MRHPVVSRYCRLAAAPLCALMAVAVAPEPAAAQAPSRSLSATERAIVAHVDAHVGEGLALLRRVVDINSGTLNTAGVRQVGEVFAHELARLGFTTRWVDGTPFRRAGHLFAERPGEGLRVLLIGHLDTVFEHDSPFQHFAAVPGPGNRARGPGIIDMKGGDVIMLQALGALRAAGVLDQLHVTVALMGDEENAGSPLSLARADLIAAGQRADVVLGFEDGDGNPTRAVVVRRGATDWRLAVSGSPAHSGQIFQPEVGAGAVYEASRILSSFYTQLAGEPNLTLSPGLILGGTQAELAGDEIHGTAAGKQNVVAGTVVVTGDLRTISPEQLASAQQRMHAIVAAHLPRTDAELTFREGYPPMASTPGNLELLATLDRVSRELGLGPVTAVDPRDAGAADVSFVAATVPRVLDALGLKGSGGHTVDEIALLDTFPTQTEKAALLLYRLGLDGRR